MSKSFWLLSAGVVALATPAYAQDDPPATTDMAQAADEASDDAQTGGSIIVTAQGRAQLLQDVPLAVSAVGGDQLQNSGANDIRQLNQLAPSLLVSSTGTEANGSTRIRGIGTVGDNPGLESSVPVFIDGVYRSRSGIGLNELGEIERIEVARGPQGTLFGRNASAGLIHIITRRPSFDFGATAELSYGNYDYIRADASLTGPLSDEIAARLDAVYVRRDGYYTVDNPTGGTESRVNDRDRMFVRGQLLIEPNDDLSFRLIADYTNREESCCGAVYLDAATNPLIGNLNNPAVPLSVGGLPPADGNNIINVLRDLGQPLAGFSNPYSRILYVSPGRSYIGDTEDMGISLEANWDLGAATLTSITAYRDYQTGQPGDIDYGRVDILFRAGDGVVREFQTLTQELRLQGEAFGGRLDWLVGAYYADEDLTVTDNLRFGNQYGRFATCRIVSGGGLAALYSPASPGCLAARPPVFGAASPIIFAAFDRLDGINDRGTTADVYSQNSRNYAFFTHNILHITDEIDFTAGLRYTNERKRFDAVFGNDNTACPAQQAALVPFLTVPALAAVAGGLIGLSCQGNSTAELNGVAISDRRSEDEWTGTGILSFRPNDDVLIYASYSRGYKAGGFNLDRSALKSPILPFSATPGGAQGLVGNLQFDPEINTAYELGFKYQSGPLTLNITAFRQQFENFQLNTFNGTVFIVQTINGCSTDLGDTDRDLSPTTGACPIDDVTYGVTSTGVEVEAALRPFRDLLLTAGLTVADTEYRDDIIGNDSGAPLDPALRMLPGDNLSNAPTTVFTSSLAWTPTIPGTNIGALFYVDARVTNDYNTGSDLFPQKEEDSYAVINARLGLRGPGNRWAIEIWAQNLFDTNYAQVAFNAPFQAGTTSPPFVDPQFPGGRQIFSAFLAEPRTYGITGRFRF
ncbi:MAG: TonB-dependent receptor [Sphingosinicella sp.]